MTRKMYVIFFIAISIVLGILVFLANKNKDTSNANLNSNSNPNASIVDVSEVFKLGGKMDLTKVTTTTEQIEAKLEKYFEKVFRAINNNDFAMVEEFYKPDSGIFLVQKNKIKYLFEKEITSRLISFEIKKIYLGDSKNLYYADVLEKIDWKFQNRYSYIDTHMSTYVVECLTGPSVNTNDFLSKIVFSEVSEKESIENSQNETKLSLKILPHRQKEDKFAMVEQAISGIREYMEVDYEASIGNSTTGCKYLPGEGLNQLLRVYDARVKKIMENKLKRKINMIQVLRSEQNGNEGVVELGLRTESNFENNLDYDDNSNVDNNSKYDDINLQISLKRVSPETWYISQIYGLVFP